MRTKKRATNMIKKRETNVIKVLLCALDCYESELTRQFMRVQDSRYFDRSGKTEKRFKRDKKDIAFVRSRILDLRKEIGL